MRVDAFDFDLPRGAIATRPARPRDSARLLDLSAGLAHRTVADLPAVLKPGDMMVFNDTRVIPARLAGTRGKAQVELTLHRQRTDGCWLAFAKPARRLRPGDVIRFADGFSATVDGRDGPEVSLVFDRQGAALDEALQRHGAMPLPPYMRRAADERDRDDYQTVYAQAGGRSRRADRRPPFHRPPAAGDRRTGHPPLLRHPARGRRHVPARLGGGHGRSPDARGGLRAGTPDAAAAINGCRAAGGRIVAVGTTVVRLLESAAAGDGTVDAFSGEVDLFIEPGYRFKAVDLMLTNFHLPRSTLFMLVCAFAGTGRMKAAYAEALAAGYRFYSYGDACLLAREDTA